MCRFRKDMQTLPIAIAFLRPGPHHSCPCFPRRYAMVRHANRARSPARSGIGAVREPVRAGAGAEAGL